MGLGSKKKFACKIRCENVEQQQTLKKVEGAERRMNQGTCYIRCAGAQQHPFAFSQFA